jgi:hypothetical protein
MTMAGMANGWKQPMNTKSFIAAFKNWTTTDFKMDAFATVNLPRAKTAPRSEAVYLNLWTRFAEADVLGPRTLKRAELDRRIVWFFRREISPDGLLHYHASVKFPENRLWRHEQSGRVNIDNRCQRLASALRAASARTPEAIRREGCSLPLTADIDVRPFDANSHAGYLLKGMWRFIEDGKDFSSDDLLRDSGLIILPHLPRKNPPRTLPDEPHKGASA